MDDSQSSPDAEDRKGDAARRAGLRLRDTETVATTRRDMFGDGSLLDALPDAPPSGEEGATEPLVPVVEGLADLPMLPTLADGADSDGPAEQAAPPAPAQSLDTIIDSFPADPLSQGEAQAPSELSPEPARLASRFTLIDRDAGQPDPATVPVPPTFPERFQVSAIFAGLGTPESNDAEATDQPADAELPDAALPDGAETEVTAGPQPDAAVPSLDGPLIYQPSIEASLPEPSDWPPAEIIDGHPSEADEPRTIAAEPLPPLTAAEPASMKEVTPPGGVSLPDSLGWPPFPEPPGGYVDADVPPLEPPTLVTAPDPITGPAGTPFPAPPAWPPFPEAPGSEADESGAVHSGLPPYIELPAYPEPQDEALRGASGAFPEALPGSTAGATRFGGPQVPPAIDDVTGPTELSEMREGAHFPDLDTDEPPFDSTARASAKIAAEANATAQALDNLQRLLTMTVTPPPAPPTAQQRPYRPQAAPTRPRNDYHQHRHQEPAPFVHEMARMLPLPMPPPRERVGGGNVYLLGFLTGLALSMMAGAALYFLINAGG